MTRIICDSYFKKDKPIWGNNPNELFNKRILAVNAMYGWLYEKGILEKVSFVFKDYAESCHFGLDTKDLIPYRKEMEAAELDNAELAVQHIFDETYTPCRFSGAIQPGWTMASYRNVDGCVGRSWECSLATNLNTKSAYDVAMVKEEQGIKSAVIALYDMFQWNPTLNEEKKFNSAKTYNLNKKIQAASSQVSDFHNISGDKVDTREH